MSTVRSTDRNSQRVATCASSEVDNLLRLGVVRLLSNNLILNASEYAEFTLYSNIILVSILYNLTRNLDVLLVWQ